MLGAAGLISLKEMRLRLIEDHDNAKYLAEELDKIQGIEVIKDALDINMVFLKLQMKDWKPSLLRKISSKMESKSILLKADL